jgi:hypothetical protein
MDEIRPVPLKIQNFSRVAARMGGEKRSRLARSPASSCATIASRRTIRETTRLTRDSEIGSTLQSMGSI